MAELKKYEDVSPTEIKDEKEAVVTKPKEQAATPLPNFTSGEGLFKMTVTRQVNAGFGVQIGVFGDYANVIKEAQKLDEAYHRNVLVSITKSGDKNVFKVILGPFAAKEQAESYLRELKSKEGRSGMVVDLGKAMSTAPVVAASPTPESRGLTMREKR
jgi:cell division septation protein DedD